MTTWDGVQRGYIPGETLRIPGTLKLHAGTADVDPVTFEVIRYSLMNTNLEHGQTIQRLAVSPVTMITRDFQPSILTESADLVFLGPYLQYFSNAQALTIKWILENRAENPGIEPGDMFVSNDPYVGTPHQPDTIVAAPVFVGDELFCWVANVMHHADVGGSVMGSFCVDAADIFTDPPAFPPFKLVSRGEVRRDLEGMFLRQSRVPTEVHMDLRAAISANRVAVGRIAALVDRYGADAVKAVMNRVLDAGERTVAQRLAKIPDGRWSHRLYAEAARTGDGWHLHLPGHRAQAGRAPLRRQRGNRPADRLHQRHLRRFLRRFPRRADRVAYRRPRRRLRRRVPAGALRTGTRHVVLRGLSRRGQPGRHLHDGNADQPVRGGDRQDAGVRRAGGGQARDRPGASGVLRLHLRRRHPTGEPFVATNADNMIGSLAASPAGDGVDFGGHFWIPEGTASNIEELELLWPMLFLYRRALKAGADGAGRFRGGRGFVEAGIPWTVPGMAAAVYVDESFPKAVGPFGANPASAGHFRLKHGTDVVVRLAAGEVPQDFDAIDGAEAEVEAKGPMLMMGADAAWEWTGANAPGFGDPLARDPGLVEADVATGALSADVAERVYGVLPGDGATRTATGAARRTPGRPARRGCTRRRPRLPWSRPACRCGCSPANWPWQNGTAAPRSS